MRTPSSWADSKPSSSRYLLVQDLFEPVERLQRAFRNNPAELLIRESFLRQHDPGLVALFDEFHQQTRGSGPEINVISDPFGLDDFVVGTCDRKLAGPGDIHLLSERTTHAKIHL